MKHLKFQEEFQLSFNLPNSEADKVRDALIKLKLPYTRAIVTGVPMLTEFNIVFPKGMKQFVLLNEYLKF